MPDSDDRLRLEILGPLRVRRGDRELEAGPHQQRCLLAVLLALPGRPLGMSELIGMLWGDDPPPTAVNVIHKYVGALRRLLEPDVARRSGGSFLQRDGSGYRFSAGPDVLDLVAFREQLARGRDESGAGRLDHYVEALARWRGRAGEGLADTVAATSVLAALDTEFVDEVVAAAAVAIELRQPARVLAPLRLAASMSPLNEPVHASLMLVLAAAGYQAPALDVFTGIRDRLDEELGLDPGPELREAHRRVLTQTTMPPGDEPRGALVDQPAQLPADLAVFAGREAELGTLRELVGDCAAGRRTGPLVIAMDGMAGVGKSTLAVHLAHLVAADFPDGQLYLDLNGHEAAGASLPVGEAVVDLLYGLCVVAPDIPDTYDAQVGTYRSLTAAKRILLVLDNVRDAGQVRPLLPGSDDSLVLITSRRPLIGLAARDGARLLRIEPPDPASARELMRRRLTAAPNRIAARDAAETEALETILEYCGRLPLALAILAARLSARPRLTLAAVAAELVEGAHTLDAFPPGSAGDPRNSFIWSYRQLTPAAARMFRLFSTPLADNVSDAACAALAGQPLAAACAQLDELTEAALLTEDGQGRFSAHILVKAYAAELFRALDPEPDRAAAAGRLLQFYLHSSRNAHALLRPEAPVTDLPPPPPGVTPEQPSSPAAALRWFTTEHAILREAVRFAADLGQGAVAWQLALTMQPALERRGYFRDWEETMRTALSAAREQRDRIGEAYMLRGLAGARAAFGDHDEARDLRRAAEALCTNS